MLALDSLVLDLIFQANANIKPELLLAALGGEAVASRRKIFDPDTQDPRLEMELFPSVPLRRQGERRLLIIDDSVAPMRRDPLAQVLVPLDLRGEKERLIRLCSAAPVRIGRLSALGSWGHAVMIARTARDLRAAALLSWVFDPTLDVDGRRRANPLTQEEIKGKILAYEQRLDELNDTQILANLGAANFARRDGLLVVDVLEADGTWDVRKSAALEENLAAVAQFSLIPGAPASGKAAGDVGRGGKGAKRAAQPAPAPETEKGPALKTTDFGERLVIIFPPERFNLDIAAALGKKDFDAILRSSDRISGPLRDRMMSEGAGFIAPLEFLSEVFVDGVPLSRSMFERGAVSLGAGGARSLEVHCPRFGPVLLVDVPERGRFISSERESVQDVLRVLSESP